MQQQLSYEEAKSLASNIKSSSDTINNLLNDSDSVVKKVSANWEGSSAEYAISDWDKWKKDFEEYYQMLLLNVKNIESACSQFVEAESQMKNQYN